MDVAIIGAGNVGSALAGALVRAGHTVTITSTTPDEARGVADRTGARFVPTNAEAAASGEVVILAVYYPSVDAVLADLAGGELDGKVVVDVTNPVRPDSSGLAVEGTSAAEEIQARIPAAKVAKAFNTVFASRQAEPEVDGVPVDGYVAADDEDAKAKVLELVGAVGLRPIDVGPLRLARALEAMGFLHISLQLRNDGTWQSAWKLVGPVPGV